MNRKVPNSIKNALYEKYNGACAFCGIRDIPLELAHIISITHGGTNDIENFLLLCPNCHRQLDSYNPREFEFVSYLEKLLENSPNYRLQKNSPVGLGPDYGFDIAAERLSQNTWGSLLIECKNYPSFSKARLTAIGKQIARYGNTIENGVFVLAFPGRISEEDKSQFLSYNIETWDIDYLAREFQEEVKQVPHPYYQPLLKAIFSGDSIEYAKGYVEQLRECKPGKATWSKYQKLIAEIFETLFCPSLNTPITELADSARINRRDIILPNYATSGFWQFMREMYQADYIVVDAKNYTEKVKKDEALQIANYLKPHGAGLFGIIVCRKGAERGCELTIREQWIANRKLILVLNDGDIEAMLLAKSTGGDPEELLSQKIEEFRLSL